jgi:hypothetical protein
MISATLRLLGAALALGLMACTSALGATSANLWIDTDGGTCTRSASAVAYSNAAACAPDAAWQASTAGDLILFKGGSYGGVRLTQKAGATTPRVTMQPETNADVTFGYLQMAGASYLTLQAPQSNHPFLVPGSGGVGFPGRDPNWNQRTTTDVTLDNFKVDGQWNTVSTLVWINGNDTNLTLDHFDVCCTYGASGGGGQLIFTDQDPSYQPNTNLTLKNSYLHDQTISDGSIHTECLWASAGKGFTIRNNVFRRCSGTGDIIFGRPVGTLGVTDVGGFVLENNLFGAGWNESGTPLAYSIQGCWFKDTVFRNNIFEADVNNAANATDYCDATHPADHPAGTATFTNNIGYHGSCGPSARYLKNTWTTVRCGSGADNPVNAGILASANFVRYNGNSLTTAPPYDLTPTAGAPQVNTGATTSWAATDFLGRTRCPGATTTWTCTAGSATGSAPDVGPVERGAT